MWAANPGQPVGIVPDGGDRGWLGDGEKPDGENTHRVITILCGVVLVALLVAMVLMATAPEGQPEPTASTAAAAESRDESAAQILATPSTVWQTTNLPPALTDAATTTATAARAESQIQVTEAVAPPFNPVAYVNGLPYCWLCPIPAQEAWRVVGTTPAPLGMGWTQEKVDARWDFGFRIMGSESAYCWNAQRWSWPTSAEGVGQPCTEISVNNCVQGSSSRKGCHDDAGFGQLTSSTRSPGDALCGTYGICTKAQTIADPWTSMKAFMIVLDDMGKQPWCFVFASGRKSHHITNGDCSTWPG